MSRPLGTPSLCHHRSSGQAYVTLNGRQVYLGKHGSKASRQEYDRIIGEWLAAGRVSPADAPTATPTVGLTVSTLLAAFWEHAVREYAPPPFRPKQRPQGEAGNYFDVIRILRPLYGATAARDFGPLKLKALREEFVRLGWKRTTINRCTNRVKAIFGWGVANELVPPSVHQGLLAVKGLRRGGRADVAEPDPVRPVPDDHLTATLPHLGPTVRKMVELQLLTGMRPGELCDMRTCDITIIGCEWVYRPAEHKTQHHGIIREIPLGPKARELLRPLLKPDLQAVIFSPAESEAERRQQLRQRRQTPLTPSHHRRAERSRRRQRVTPPSDRYTVYSYRRAVVRACARADRWAKGGRVCGKDDRIIPAWHPHQLRHSFATLVRAKFGAEAVLTAIGDKTTRLIDVYAERDRQLAAKVAEAIG